MLANKGRVRVGDRERDWLREHNCSRFPGAQLLKAVVTSSITRF